MSSDLYDGKTEVIYYNEVYKIIMEEKYPNFENKTKVIYTYENVEEIKDISKGVNVTKDLFIIYVSAIDTYGKVPTVSRLMLIC